MLGFYFVEAEVEVQRAYGFNEEVAREEFPYDLLNFAMGAVFALAGRGEDFFAVLEDEGL